MHWPSCSLQVVRSVAKVASPTPTGHLASAYKGGVRGGGRDWRVLLPAGEAVVGSGVRSFGVVDSVQTKIINRSVVKQGEPCGGHEYFSIFFLVDSVPLVL